MVLLVKEDGREMAAMSEDREIKTLDIGEASCIELHICQNTELPTFWPKALAIQGRKLAPGRDLCFQSSHDIDEQDNMTPETDRRRGEIFCFLLYSLSSRLHSLHFLTSGEKNDN